MPPLEKVFNQAIKLPTISKVVYELIEMSRADDVDLGHIIEKVMQDQAITAKVIRIANSSFYGKSRQVSSVEKAINIIGLQTLRITVITAGVMAAFPSLTGMDVRRYWQHELKCAFMAMEIAKLTSFDTDDAFTAGLMHGLGVLIIHMSLPDKALQISELIDPLDCHERVKVDIAVLGFSHNIVCSELLDRWRFPSSIIQAIREYPEVTSGNRLAEIINLASRYATLSNKGYNDNQIFDLIKNKHISGTFLTKTWLENIGQTVKKAVDAIVISP